MSDFKPIETQEELDAIILKRVEQAKRSVRQELEEQYAGYDELKAKAEGLEKELETNKQRVAELEPLEEKVRTYETDSVKTRIALEEGLPYSFASRLNGDTEEAIREDAKSISKVFGAQNRAPLGGAEQVLTKEGTRDAALRQMAQDLDQGE